MNKEYERRILHTVTGNSGFGRDYSSPTCIASPLSLSMCKESLNPISNHYSPGKSPSFRTMNLASPYTSVSRVYLICFLYFSTFLYHSFHTFFLSMKQPVKTSPYKPIYSDRYIPIREPTYWDIQFNKNKDPVLDPRLIPDKKKKETEEGNKKCIAYQCLLKNELLGEGIEDINEYRQSEDRKVFSPIINRNIFRVSVHVL